MWTAANDHYLIGTFDGNRFMPEVMTQPGHSGENYYAVQTYSGLPNGRRVQVSWMKGGVYPHMPFNQQMSFPYELKLRRFGLTLKLCALPVREIESLSEAPRSWSDLEVKPGNNPLLGLWANCGTSMPNSRQAARRPSDSGFAASPLLTM